MKVITTRGGVPIRAGPPYYKRAPKKLNKVQKLQVTKMIKAPAEVFYRSEPLRALTGLSTLSTWGGFSSAITGTGEIYAAIPRTSQGNDDYQRRGNQLYCRSVHVKLDVCAKVWNDNSSQDRTVHIFLLTAKSVKSLDNYTAIPITQLLNKGDGTNVGFDGLQLHAQYPVNTSEFTVLRHIQKRMVQGFGQSKGTTAATAGTTDSVISPAASYAHINMKVNVPKVFKYDRQSQEYPTNTAPFIVIGFTDNNTVTSAPLDYVQVMGQTQMYFTDE